MMMITILLLLPGTIMMMITMIRMMAGDEDVAVAVATDCEDRDE